MGSLSGGVSVRRESLSGKGLFQERDSLSRGGTLSGRGLCQEEKHDFAPNFICRR